ncbi:hypothetical protein [Microbacterium phyllosphaerae]|uniref:hypothetical protein n=1 Tax=Microbacterium phyllosphaerae TaxID=124798 RepID=UPI003D64AE22
MWSVRTSHIDAGLVCRWLLLAAWPMHAAFAALSAVVVSVAVITEQDAILSAVAMLGAHYALGLGGSFAMHELGHLTVLSRARGVTAFTLQRSTWRISIAPHGQITRRDAALAALAGPGICVVAGGILWLVVPELQVHGWYLAHAVFLVPVFNDGRILLAAMRARSTAPPRRQE